MAKGFSTMSEANYAQFKTEIHRTVIESTAPPQKIVRRTGVGFPIYPNLGIVISGNTYLIERVKYDEDTNILHGYLEADRYAIQFPHYFPSVQSYLDEGWEIE